MVLPGLGDCILTTEGYSGQLTTVPRDPDRPDNLFTPPPGDPGAHGRFDQQASSDVVGFDPSWLRMGMLGLGLGMMAGAFAFGRFTAGGQVDTRKDIGNGQDR